MSKVSVVASENWVDVCSVEDLISNSGVCALVDGQEVAIFSVRVDGEQRVFAISNWDPIGEANVLYRGIVGSIGDDIVVASPLYKQHFSLVSGKCYENDDVSVLALATQVSEQRVLVMI